MPKLYLTAGRLVSAGIDYSLASQLCGAMHTGTATAIKDDHAWRVRIDESHHDKPYGALELIGVGKPGGPDFSMQLLSSNQERNLLSLMARTQAEEFDAQSHLFEREMISSLLSASRPEGVALRSNVCLRIEGHEEEIDVLLIDECGRRLLVCELRWILGPGDPREVQNRKRECLKKVSQVRRKVERISARAAAAASLAQNRALSSDSADHWVTTGVVLIAGFGGMRSADAGYPIIPVALFERAMAKASSLDALAAWCEGLSWLPREGKHFSVVTMEIALADSKPLIVEGGEAPDSAADFVSDAIACLSPRAPAQ